MAINRLPDPPTHPLVNLMVDRSPTHDKNKGASTYFHVSKRWAHHKPGAQSILIPMSAMILVGFSGCILMNNIIMRVHDNVRGYADLHLFRFIRGCLRQNIANTICETLDTSETKSAR